MVPIARTKETIQPDRRGSCLPVGITDMESESKFEGWTYDPDHESKDGDPKGTAQTGRLEEECPNAAISRR